MTTAQLLADLAAKLADADHACREYNKAREELHVLAQRCEAAEQRAQDFQRSAVAAAHELASIDAVLARRPALDKPTRRENIEHAISVAARADELQRERDAAAHRAEALQHQLNARETLDPERVDLKALDAYRQRADAAESASDRLRNLLRDCGVELKSLVDTIEAETGKR